MMERARPVRQAVRYDFHPASICRGGQWQSKMIPTPSADLGLTTLFLLNARKVSGLHTRGNDGANAMTTSCSRTQAIRLRSGRPRQAFPA